MIEYSEKTRYVWRKIMFGHKSGMDRPKTDATYLNYDHRYFKNTNKYLRSYGYFDLHLIKKSYSRKW